MTDSNGAIWRSHRGGPFAIWAEGGLLAPLPTNPLGFALPGANGIVFHPPDALYVANTERGLIARVRIEPDGSAGPMEAVTPPFAVPTVDGIAVDVYGDIYVAMPGFAILPGTSPVMRVDAETGAVSPLVTDPTAVAAFDTPLSLAFGTGRWGKKTVLVTNGDLPIAPGPHGPGVVRVGVGVPGFR